jgi:hypothetical protein
MTEADTLIAEMTEQQPEFTHDEEINPLEAYLMKHKARCKTWFHAHGYLDRNGEPQLRKPFPILEIDGSFHWMNRAERRKR